ncbi:MAG TPA: hypothetical protein VF812_06660 [Ktedonobacterales bacterium]
MAKPQITRLWVIGVIVMVAGLIVAGIATGLMLAYGGHFVATVTGNGSEFIPNTDSSFWTPVWVIVLGGIIALAGAIAQLAAWIGALVSTYRLVDKTWFIVLLAGGLIGLAFSLAHFAVMLAYVIAGPDERALRLPEYPIQPPLPPRPTMTAPAG